MEQNNMTLEDLKAIDKAQKDNYWNEFTRVSAREFMCQTIRKGDYWNERSEANVAERSVRWARALTAELKKSEEEN